MKPLIGLVLGLTVVSMGIGAIGFQPAGIVWAGPATQHDHSGGGGTPSAAATPQTPSAPDGQQMAKMRQDMMARMTALDDQITALGAEMNAATTTDAKLTAMTKLLNVLLEQRSMMRMQMDMQGKMMEQMMSMHEMMQQMKTPH